MREVEVTLESLLAQKRLVPNNVTSDPTGGRLQLVTCQLIEILRTLAGNMPWKRKFCFSKLSSMNFNYLKQLGIIYTH